MFKTSKYRHTSGRIDKKELWYPDVQTSSNSSASTFVKANSKWVAINWQSNTGTIGLIPLKSYGKRKGETFLIHAHSSVITDFEFNPFNEHQLITASDDSTIKVWDIKEAIQSGATSLSTPTITLSGHGKSIDSIALNPVASNILASTSQDKTLKIWDFSTGGQEKYSFNFDSGSLTSLSWNYDGSLLAATGKDLKNRIINPRTGESIQIGEGNQGVKASRVVWLGNSPFILTSGFSKMRERQIILWNSNDLSKPIKSITLDSSTGIINPIYDQDAQLLFICGSGDSTIRVFDMNTQFTKEPAFNEISSVPSDTPSKGICSLPKRALDVMEVEIDRLLKATPNNIIPVTFTMSRKSKSTFADDLFPNTCSTKPALTCDQWLSGENKDPILVSLNPSDNQIDHTDDLFNNLSIVEPEKKSTFFVDDNNEKQEVEEVEEKEEEIKPITTPITPSSPIIENITRTGIVPKVVRSSKYRHIAGAAVQKSQFYTNLKINGSQSNTCIAVNDEYVAVPMVGIGGPLAVIPLSDKGRQLQVPCIEIGSQLCDFDLSQFNKSLVATGSEDSHVKLFKIPTGGIPKGGKNYTTVEADFIGHNRKVVSVNFHPTAENVLISTGGDMVVKLWDLAEGGAGEKLSFNQHTDMITSVDVNWTGDKILTSCKDKKMRIFDPRTKNGVSNEVISHSGSKGGKAIWLGQTGNIFTVGFSKSSEREYQLWDSRNFGSGSLVTEKLDNLSGIITPYFDEDTSVVYLAGKGDSSIRMFEINDEGPFVHYLTQFSAGSPQVGVAKFANKSLYDVKKCEIARFYRATDSTIEPITMTVPRNRMEYFQDDIYSLTRQVCKPTMNSEEYFDGCIREPEYVSLKPSDMINLSDAPPPPKKEERIIGSQILDHTPTKDQVTNSLLSRVSTSGATSNWQQIEKLKNNVAISHDIGYDTGDISDSEWD